MFFILRNTVLTPREIIPTRRNNLHQGVRSIGKLYVPPENSTYTPCKIEPFAFPIIPVIRSPQYRSLDRTQIVKIPRYLWCLADSKGSPWMVYLQSTGDFELKIPSTLIRIYFSNRIVFYTNRPSVHTKGIRATSNFIAHIPTRSIRQMLATFFWR